MSEIENFSDVRHFGELSEIRTFLFRFLMCLKTGNTNVQISHLYCMHIQIDGILGKILLVALN